MKRIVDAAQAGGRDVSVCGQMAQDERYTAYFLGIGVKKFSLDPHHLAKIQNVIQQTSLKLARTVTKELLQKPYLKDIQSLLMRPE